jgi:hypothetical protein
VTDFLDDKRKEINDRLAVLKPAVAEYERLEAAASALAKLGGPTPVAATSTAATVAAPRRKKRPGRPRGAGRRKKVVKAAAVATAAAPEAATPTAVRKGPGRPKGSGRKVGRPPGSGKKVGRPAGKAGRPKGSGKKVGRPKGRGGRPKGGGKRATEALSFVQGQPGITIPELAAKMGIKQNYLYRVLPPLEKDGKLEKKGRGWHPKGR